ncbi:MAG: 16S rRNA (uracil(1498)-N(3))-methyltransferase [Beijerinckiaceae bacterium]
MARYDFRAQRLFIEDALGAGASIALDRDRSHYLAHVLRLRQGDSILLFNGRDGEWRALIAEVGKKSVSLDVVEQLRPQTPPRDLLYAFAPLKHARLDYMVQKAVEMGATRLAPVITQHTQAQRINAQRMRANAIEAAEQCGVLAIPQIEPERKLAAFLDSIEPNQLLVFCDEDADVANPVDALRGWPARQQNHSRLAILIGPEGGFSNGERALISSRELVVKISLGPRILRADTAAVAALSVVQAALGDWN